VVAIGFTLWCGLELLRTATGLFTEASFWVVNVSEMMMQLAVEQRVHSQLFAFVDVAVCTKAVALPTCRLAGLLAPLAAGFFQLCSKHLVFLWMALSQQLAVVSSRTAKHAIAYNSVLTGGTKARVVQQLVCSPLLHLYFLPL